MAEIDNNIAERAIRSIAIGRKNWLFAGSKAGGERAAAIYSVIETAKLNGVEPQAYIADVIEKIASGWPASRWDELMPWNWQLDEQQQDATAAYLRPSAQHSPGIPNEPRGVKADLSNPSSIY